MPLDHPKPDSDIDPADIWDAYCAETKPSRRSPQGAIAFAVHATIAALEPVPAQTAPASPQEWLDHVKLVDQIATLIETKCEANVVGSITGATFVAEEIAKLFSDDLAEWKQAASVEAGLRREFLARAESAEAEVEALKHDIDRSQETNERLLANCPPQVVGWPLEPTPHMLQAACDATFGPEALSPQEAHRLGYIAMRRVACAAPPTGAESLAEVKRLLTKIADLVDAEDANDPLDDAISYANKALAYFQEATEQKP